MVRHLPDHPVDNVQRCNWCRKVLVEWWPEIEARHPRSLFFKPGVEIVDHGGSYMRTKTDDEDRVPCCTPDVDNVDIT